VSLSDVIGVAEVALAAVGLVAAFVIYRWQRHHKALSFTIVTNRPLLTTPSPFTVTVQHNGKNVGEPRLVVLRIANTGNVPIETADFEQSLSITFLYCQLLSAEVTGSRPDELTTNLKLDGPTLILDPCLLNPSDLIEIQCLLDGSLEEFRIACRIIGVQSVRQVNLPRDSWGKVWRVSSSDVVILSLAPLMAIGLATLAFRGGNVFFGIAVLLGGLLWTWWGIRTFRRSRLWLALPPPKGH
jgi:hypothetical protein